MNVPIVDPLQGDFPEVIEEFLQHGNMKCIAFNRRGTLLAAGCANGSCVIWDFETRGIARELRDKDCTAPITSVCWSKYGHRLLASATDRSLTLWNVVTGEKIARITLQQTPLHASLHPGSSTPSICLACPLSSAPILVDLNTGSTTVLPVSVSDNGNPPAPNSRNKFSDGSPPFTPTAATFDKHGDLIYVGNSKGEILIVDSKSIQVHAVISIPGGTVVKDIAFSRHGQYLLTNSNDRVIRVYENVLPVKGSGKEIEKISNNNDDYESHYEKLKANGARCLILSCELSDAITKIQWKAPCFSGDGEWIVGASASKGEHRLYIWDRAGRLVKILEGPKEALIDLAWHPVEPTIVSVSVAGLTYIWAKEHVENWSAFAPDFVELEENEEYVEREDEFDMNAYTEKVEELVVDENADVDVETFEKNSAFSDLEEDSVNEIIYLPAIPSPDDAPDEQPDKCLASSSKLEDSNHSGSPSSMDVVQNGQAIPPASSPLEVDNSTAEEPAEAANSKRKRRLSVKGLELQQAEKGKKPTIKNKSNAKSLKSKSKQVELGNGNSSAVDDEATEDDEM